MLKTNIIDTINQKLSATDKELFLVFDRDGTLVPFTENPADAIFDSRVRDSLNNLAARPGVHVGILSARSIKQLQLDLPGGKHILAGNYGLEIEVPAVTRFCLPQAQGALQHLSEARNLLVKKMQAESNYILEDHGLSLCLHWHKTPEILQTQLHLLVSEIAADSPELYFKRLGTSYEVWPALDWNKANGMKKMLQLANLNVEQVMLLFAGDSLVDEPAFTWVNQHNGISLLVGNRDSEAQFTVESPLQLHELIYRLEETCLKIAV